MRILYSFIKVIYKKKMRESDFFFKCCNDSIIFDFLFYFIFDIEIQYNTSI